MKEIISPHEIFSVLKGVVQFSQPMWIAEDENIAFFSKARRVCSFEHFPFVQRFHREHSIGVFQFHHRH